MPSHFTLAFDYVCSCYCFDTVSYILGWPQTAFISQILGLQMCITTSNFVFLRTEPRDFTDASRSH